MLKEIITRFRKKSIDAFADSEIVHKYTESKIERAYDESSGLYKYIKTDKFEYSSHVRNIDVYSTILVMPEITFEEASRMSLSFLYDIDDLHMKEDVSKYTHYSMENLEKKTRIGLREYIFSDGSSCSASCEYPDR